MHFLAEQHSSDALSRCLAEQWLTLTCQFASYQIALTLCTGLSQSYKLADAEANVLLPCLVEKAGHSQVRG